MKTISGALILKFLFFLALISCNHGEEQIKQELVPNVQTEQMCPLEVKRSELEADIDSKVLIIQVTSDNQIYYEGGLTEKDSLGIQILNSLTSCSNQQKETYQVALIVHESTGMRIVTDIKEQLKEIGAIRIIFLFEQDLLLNIC